MQGLLPMNGRLLFSKDSGIDRGIVEGFGSKKYSNKK